MIFLHIHKILRQYFHSINSETRSTRICPFHFTVQLICTLPNVQVNETCPSISYLSFDIISQEKCVKYEIQEIPLLERAKSGGKCGGTVIHTDASASSGVRLKRENARASRSQLKAL